MTFFKQRKRSDIGVMMAIDALIENGYVIMEPDKNEQLIGTPFEIDIDKDFHVDITAYKVDDENIELWKDRRPRPTPIDVKYAKYPATITNNLFFEVDNNKRNYGTRDGWGLYVYDEYAEPETRQRIADEQEAIRNIMYLEQNIKSDVMIMQATTKEDLIARYKATRPNRMSFIITPLHCMQWHYAEYEDKTAINNHQSKLSRIDNGLLMPLSDYSERYPYIIGRWNTTAQQWDIHPLGNGSMPRNKLARKGKLLEEDKAAKSLQQWQDEQREQWLKGTLDYDKLASLF